MGKKNKEAVVKEEVVVKEEEEEAGQLDEGMETVIDDIKSEPEEAAPKRNQKARLIVRNLSFKATTKKLRKFFSSYGDLTDIQILRQPNGRLVGCAFVEFALKNSAAKAIAHVSGKPFLDRTVVVDWAVQKDKFSKKNVPEDNETSGLLESDDKSGIKKEHIDDDNDSQESKDDNSGGDEHSEASEESENGDEDSEEEGDDESEAETDKEHIKAGLKPRKPLRESHDISEGCTVFVKNIPFSVNNQEFKKCMRKFGQLYYALICIDPLTEHSKGTGFVKFRSKDMADSCIAAGRNSEIDLHGSVLETQSALSREDLQKGASRKETKKDNRNLYLVKEGIILAGSSAVSGVSQADMAKRLQLEQWKTQMLRNLNKFVSRYRLVVQNLPPTYDDQKLRALCLKYGGTKPVIREARVMRDLRNVDATGKGKSKEFGFVTFTEHENALHALRALNNNPDIFTAAKRPIVAFSIEDKKAINARQKRLEKSRTGLLKSKTNNLSQKEWEQKRRDDNTQTGNKKNNARGRSNDNQTPSHNVQEEKTVSQQPNDNSEKKLSKREKNKLKLQKLREKKVEIDKKEPKNIVRAEFMGETGKQGQSGIMSRKKLRAQAELQSQMMKLKNKKERKKQQISSNMKIKQPKQKLNKRKDMQEDPNFSKLVNKYRSQLASSEVERKKWYE